MFGNKVQVQVQSQSGLFADATKLKPRSMALEVIKGIVFGAFTGTITGAGIGAGIQHIRHRNSSDDIYDKALDTGIVKGLGFGSVSGALVGAFWKYQQTKVHNAWVDTVAGRMGMPQDPNASFTQREDQRIENKAATKETAPTGMTLF